MGLEQRCIKCLYFSCLLNIGLTQLKYQASSLHYMGEFPYRNALSFVKGNQSCGVPSEKFSSLLKREDNDQDVSESDYTCLLFLDYDLSENNSLLRISDAYAEIHEYDIEYKFKLIPFNCTFQKDVQNVNLFMTCFQRKDHVAKTCQYGKGCDDDLELCQHYRDFQKSICIPKRKYNESCGMHSQCYENTICTQTEPRKSLCLCKEGFEFMNGDCLKVGIALGKDCVDSRQCKGEEITADCVYDANTTRHVCSCNAAFIESNGKCLQRNRRLYESCESSLQCRGTHGAKECKNVQGIKFCYCPGGYDIINGSACIKVGKSIGESCLLNEECTGTQNAFQCQLYNETGIRICQCNLGFIRHKNQCLQANRVLYEDCVLNDQCNGTSGAGVCKTVRDKGLCVCASNYIEDKDILRCRRAKKNIFDSCKIDEQCTGTENAGVCLYDKHYERNVCSCNDGYIWHKKKCIKSEILLFESCEYDIQCNGTEAADVCKTFGERQICYCKPGHLELEGRCIEGERHLGEPCETNKQCLSVQDSIICSQNLSCSCKDGYFKVGQECVKATRKMFESCKYDIQCTGTPNASRCESIIEDVTICVCSIGHFEYNGKCFEGDKRINETCEIDLQCNGTKHAGVCGENLTCICGPGFLVVNELQDCIQGNLSLGQSCVESSQCTGTENSGQCVDGQCSCEVGFHLNNLQCIPGKKHPFLLVGAGVLLLVITVSIILSIIVCRRKLKSRSGRMVVHTVDNVPEDHNYYTYAIHGNIRNTVESQIPLSHSDCSYTGDTFYDTTHHAEEQTTENLYDVSEPLSTFRDLASSEGVYMYNHLHDKETQLCENLYDVTELPVSPKTDA